jgi:hypothetical protein
VLEQRKHHFAVGVVAEDAVEAGEQPAAKRPGKPRRIQGGNQDAFQGRRRRRAHPRPAGACLDRHAAVSPAAVTLGETANMHKPAV